MRKSWKLAAILDMAAILIFYMTAWHTKLCFETQTNIVLYALTFKLVPKTKLFASIWNDWVPGHPILASVGLLLREIEVHKNK